MIGVVDLIAEQMILYGIEDQIQAGNDRGNDRGIGTTPPLVVLAPGCLAQIKTGIRLLGE
jgi:hypothetical protein